MRRRFVFFMDEETGGGSGGAEGAAGAADATRTAESAAAGAEDATGGAKEAGEGEKGGGGGDDADGKDVNLLRDAGKEKSGSEGKEGAEESGKEAGETAPSRVELDQLTLPEVKGLEPDEELGKSFLEVVNDESLSRADLAQKLVDLYAAQQGGMLEAMRAAEAAAEEKSKQEDAAERAAWAKASREDPEFGGAKFEASMNVIAAGRDKVASQELTEIVQILGLENHPEILRMYYRAGKLTQEDRSAGAGGSGGAAPKPIEDRIFGEVTKNL